MSGAAGADGPADELIVEQRGSIRWITFNRPQARNALTWNMYSRLEAACHEVNADRGVRAVVLTGAGGKAFVAGTDIGQFRAFKTEQDALDYEARGDLVMSTLESVRVPTIAAIAGACTGAGAAIASCCDLRIASPSARYGFPIARTLGNCLSGASYSRLVDVMGPGAVKDLLFTGRLIGGAEAQALGIVNRLVPAAGIEGTVRALAAEIAANAPLTLRATKEMIRRVLAKRRLAAGDDADMVEMCYTSADFREGVTAFLAKRKPSWSGS